MNKQKKISYINNIRAFCMLWIIGFWHLGGVSEFNSSNRITLLFTKGCLGTFVYISGFLLANKKISNKKEVFDFYKKKFIRIYPLFFISTTLFYILYLWDSSFWYVMSLKQYILSILGLACIIPPAPGTVWFIDMMFLFWGITPLIIVVKSRKRKALLGLVVYIVIFAIVRFGGDERLLIYFPMYLGGVLHDERNVLRKEKALTLVYGGIFVLLSLCYMKVSNSTVLCFVEVLGEVAVIGILARIAKYVEKLSYTALDNALNWLGYVSMAAYLFHSQIYETLYRAFGTFSIWVAYLVVLPLVFAIAYVIQKAYDRLVQKL